MSDQHRSPRTGGGRRNHIDFRLKTDDGRVPEDLYDRDAERIAGALVEPVGGNRVKGVSRHRLRRLFDEVKRIQRRLQFTTEQDRDATWSAVLPLVKLLKSKVAYVAARAERGEQEYYDALKIFFTVGIDQIFTAEDFERFATLFEAVYGFYYERGGSKTA
ncbi:MAG: type III-A CRISPR-associated protein Csm2 [Spirochaetia bacterium]